MNIWAFNQPDEEAIDFVYSSVANGFSRFGWSYNDSTDLRKLNEKNWEDMKDYEIDCYKKSLFLLQIKKDDWIVHINVPEWGQCTAVKVKGGYSFDKSHNNLGKEYSKTGDYRHFIEVDPNTKIVFDRNNENILPNISRVLKLRGNHWSIYNVDDFIKSIENFKNNSVKLKENETTGLYFLKKDVTYTLKEITKLIQKNHPEKKLEVFIQQIFSKIPNVTNVKLNGSGWKSDHGADLIVYYQSGLQILDLKKEEILVVQVKSYENVHYDLKAVDQIVTAIDKFKANMGMIITTAEKSEDLENAVSKYSEKIDKPIILIAGEDVAKFVLKYGSEFLFDL